MTQAVGLRLSQFSLPLPSFLSALVLGFCLFVCSLNTTWPRQTESILSSKACCFHWVPNCSWDFFIFGLHLFSAPPSLDILAFISTFQLPVRLSKLSYPIYRQANWLWKYRTLGIDLKRLRCLLNMDNTEKLSQVV